MIDREYEFTIGRHINVFFTCESRIEFWDTETDGEIFSIDPTDLSVVLTTYNHVMELFRRYDAEDKLLDGGN